MLLLIPLLPLVGFLINAALGRRMVKAAAAIVACSAMFTSFVVAFGSVLRLVGLPPESRVLSVPVFDWIRSGDFDIPFTLRLDPLSAVMILVVTGIGFLIHVYSTAYMHEETDPEFARYFSYLNLFAAFMLTLVLGANFLVMFVGWEGVGLCSYLLIGFWFQKKSAVDAGKKAFIVNRIGDWGFLLGMLLVFVHFGSLDFREVARAASARAPEAGFGVVSVMTLLLFVGATGKSAQIPLFVWLPDAMEGPTPVSALIHAATMVTAGVYMVARNAVLFGHAPQTLAIVAVVGVATALGAGTIGLVQYDIKRVLAYSTVSQLGYMFLAMGVGAYAAGIFHLYTHAFFKALLFLGSGAVIHALAGEQDMRRMGGLKEALPLTYWTFVTGALAIAGVPGLAGFFSKDEILYRTFAGGHTLLWVVGLLTSLLTAAYMFRLVFLTFHGTRAGAGAPMPPSGRATPPAYPEEEEPAATHGSAHAANRGSHGTHLHDAPPAMAVALVVLAVGSVAAGYVGLPEVLGGSNWFERFLAPSFTVAPFENAVTDHGLAEGGGPEMTLMLVSTLVAFAGIGIAWYFFLRNKRAADVVAARFSGLHRTLVNKYYVDEIYDAAIVQPVRIVSEDGLWKRVDIGLIDRIVNGVGRSVSFGSETMRRVQTGSVRGYAVSLFLGVVLVVGYYLWR